MLRILPLVLGAAPAFADAATDCYCTDGSGARVELGARICLQVDGRMFTAQCQMSLNVPMWREISEGCLSSSLGVPGEPAVQPGGVHPQI